MENRYRLPARLVRARACVGQHFQKLVNRYMKSIRIARLQRGYDETFYKMAESPTWQALCRQVFDQYVGQFSFTHVKQIQFLAGKLHISSRSHVLDLASGTGGLSLYLAELTGCRLTGLDASPLAVRIANKQAMLLGLTQRVRFEYGVLPELPYEECSFNVVVSIDSVYGIADKTSLFRSCYRVLRRGGCLGFFTLYMRRRFYAENVIRARAFYWFPLQPYSKLLEETGFEAILKIDLSKDFMLLSKRWVKALQENRESLDRELGRKTAEGFLADIGTAWVLATEGYVGRALFKAKKPL